MAALFSYCSYWGMWSRVLTTGSPSGPLRDALRSIDNGYYSQTTDEQARILRNMRLIKGYNMTPLGHAVLNGPTVEVNLTPVRGNCASVQEWNKQVNGVRIRAHCTAPNRGDKFVYELPSHVKADMDNYILADTINMLLNEDILSMIDWRRYKINNNGGCDLKDCTIQI